MRKLHLLFAAAIVAGTTVTSTALFGQAAPQTPADGFPAQGAPAVVKLISTGGEPRSPLRYKVSSGLKARTSATMAMGMSMDMGGMAMPEMKMPVMKMEVAMTVTSVAANGDIAFAMSIPSASFDTAGVDPAIAAAMQGVNTDMSAVTTTGVMTSRGLTNQALSYDKVTDPQLKQVLETAGPMVQSMSFPFPEEPVGIGAKWEVRQRANSGGIMAMSTATAELVAVEGSKITLKITTSQTAPPQVMKNPALPAEVEATLSKFSGTSTGTAVIDLAQLSYDGETNGRIVMDLQVAMAGMQQTMAMTTSMKVTTAAIR